MYNTHQKKHVKNNHSKELVLLSPDNNETYAQIINSKGDARFEVKILSSNKLVIAKAKGSLIKGPRKQRIFKDDYVLIQENPESDSKYYILYKYSSDDVKKLKKLNEIVFHNNNKYLNSEEDDNNIQTNIIFEDDIKSDGEQSVEYDDEFIANI